MLILVVRHADALPVGEENISTDAERTLSSRGREQAELLGKYLLTQSLVPNHIWCSPRERTFQTAEILATALGLPITPESRRELEMDKLDTQALADALAETKASTVIIVGHNPDIAAYAAWLTDSFHKDFQTASAAMIDVPARASRHSGSLIWLKHPGDY